MSLESKVMARLPWLLGGALLLLAVNLLLYFFGVSRLDNHAKNYGAKSDDNAKLLVTLEAEAAELAGGVGRLAQGKLVLEKLASETLKTRESRMISVQEELQKLMRDAGVTADQIAYRYDKVPSKQKEAWSRSYVRMDVQLTVAGSYPQVKGFIKSLHASPHFFVLEGLSVSSSAQGTVVLRAALQLSTYFVYTEEDKTP